MCISNQCQKWILLSFPSPVQVPHTLLPHFIPWHHPSVHQLSQKHGNLSKFFLSLPPPLSQSAVEFCQYQLLHGLTNPSSSPPTSPQLHLCSSSSPPGLPDFHLALPSPPATIPTCYHKSDVARPLPKRIHGYCLPSEESSEKSTKSDLTWLLSVQPISCFSTHPAPTLSQPLLLLAILHLSPSSPHIFSSLNTLSSWLVPLTAFSSPLYAWLLFPLQVSTPLGMLL